MKIIIDTACLSELDINMLSFLAENGVVSEPEAEEPVVETPKPVKTTKAKTEPKAEPVVEAEPETPAEEPEEDLIDAPEDDGDAPTMSDAVAAATELVSSGNAAQVKAALAKVGDVKRVSELKDDQIKTFLDALKA